MNASVIASHNKADNHTGYKPFCKETTLSVLSLLLLAHKQAGRPKILRCQRILNKWIVGMCSGKQPITIPRGNTVVFGSVNAHRIDWLSDQLGIG